MLQRPVSGVERQLRRLDQAREVNAFQGPDGYPAFKIFGVKDAGDHLTPAVYELARAEAWPVRELRRDVRTLEMVFNELALSSDAVSSTGEALATESVQVAEVTA